MPIFRAGMSFGDAELGSGLPAVRNRSGGGSFGDFRVEVSVELAAGGATIVGVTVIDAIAAELALALGAVSSA